jgi:hypothetical protein
MIFRWRTSMVIHHSLPSTVLPYASRCEHRLGLTIRTVDDGGLERLALEKTTSVAELVRLRGGVREV